MNRLSTLRSQSPNAPKGLPRVEANDTATSALYPTDHNLPKDRGYNFATMVTGSGSGPIL